MPYGQQTLWPEHCRQGTAGAAFHPELAIDRAELIIRKGFRPEIDSYSAFFENDRRTPTGLAGYLRDRGLRRSFMVGLATDFCVHYSAVDARRRPFALILRNLRRTPLTASSGDTTYPVSSIQASAREQDMNAPPKIDPVTAHSDSDVVHWLTNDTRDERFIDNIFGELCVRLQRAGIPVKRASFHS